jgi:UDP-N-acetylglucosamine--N-acetylmuramyl-(pentapeptide) pyrophosphoryl-undecaprenol N-acetylglucosamine transferase
VQRDDFIEDMAGAYRWSDVVIARAGALTVSELAATGTASILIPLPHAIDDHQTANAKVLSDTGAAVLMPQAEATPERLAERLIEWIKTPSRLADMAAAATAATPKGAADRVKVELERVVYEQA